MKRLVFVFLVSAISSVAQTDNRFLQYIAEPSEVVLYWKDDKGQIIGSIRNLKSFVESKKKTLKFAMNGGMYKADHSAQGLFIENKVKHAPLDKSKGGSGNFYLKPNGVFYITNDNKAVVCQTNELNDDKAIKYATQSGPMLLVDGEIHTAFKEGSVNRNIRNGVGILPDGRVVFVISKQMVNFYDFAMYFKKLNCKNALYLDGFVSRAYFADEKWKQMDGEFAVIIGVVK